MAGTSDARFSASMDEPRYSNFDMATVIVVAGLIAVWIVLYTVVAIQTLLT